MANSKFNFPDYKKAKYLLRALDNSHRFKILHLIENSNAPKNVTEIYKALGWEQSAASQHLAILRKSRILYTERNGKEVYYHINFAQVDLANKISKLIVDTLYKK